MIWSHKNCTLQWCDVQCDGLYAWSASPDVRKQLLFLNHETNCHIITIISNVQTPSNFFYLIAIVLPLQPKNDNDQPTFDKLPAEMIREILLRLNDYRDLVNSAQASPVMRTMINSQYIWRQLCRYHFTDQQLKLAFDSHNLSLTSNKKGNTRGVKYARTTSADGRSSYRNPVEHKSSPSNRKPVVDQTNQQQQQQRRDSIRSNSSQANNPVHPNSSSSYVTRAIRIFDQEGSSLTLGSSRHPSNHVESSTKQQKQQRAPLASQQQKPRGSSQKQDEVNRGQNISSNNVGQTSPEIDWERVFHQLRK